MKAPPFCCLAETTIEQAALLMSNHDCGAILVLENLESKHPAGIVTDRDLACRAAAQGKDPRITPVSEVMTKTVVSISGESTLEECCDAMRVSLVRRLPVLDTAGECIGMIAQADLILHGNDPEVMGTLRAISQPTPEPSRTAILTA